MSFPASTAEAIRVSIFAFVTPRLPVDTPESGPSAKATLETLKNSPAAINTAIPKRATVTIFTVLTLFIIYFLS